MSHAFEQINAARIGVICLSASSKLSASCLHGYSVSIQKIQGFFWKAIFAIPPIVPAVTIHTLPWNMASSLVLFLFGHGVETSNLGDVSAQKLCQASGDFSLEQVGIDVSAPCTHDSNSIDVYTATHARGSRKVQEDRWRVTLSGVIFSDTVTCFATRKSCSNRSHLSGCFKRSSLLACKAPRVQLSICFPSSLSSIHLTASPLVSCRLLLRQSVWTSWEFSLEEVGISPTYQMTYLLLGRIKVPHLLSIRTMECWLATLNASSPIMSHALEQINAARIGVICISASSKLSVSCLHGYSVSIQKIQGFFWKAIFAIPPLVPAVTIHTLPWKMRVETCPLFFQYGILPGSFPFRAWCGDFQFRGCISTKTLSSKRGLLTGTSWNWRVCPLHAWQ